MDRKKLAKSLMLLTALSYATPGYSAMSKTQFEILSGTTPADLKTLDAATGGVTTKNFIADMTTAKAALGSGAQSITADITAMNALFDTNANLTTAVGLFKAQDATWAANMALTTVTSATTLLQKLTDLRTALWNREAHSSQATSAGTDHIPTKVGGGASTVTNMTFADWMKNSVAKGLVA